MPPRKDTQICKRCKQALPRDAYDLCQLVNGRIRLYQHCRECRLEAGHYGGSGRPSLDPPNPSGLCMCGCGGTTNIAKRSGYVNGSLRAKGEHVRYMIGHGSRDKGSPDHWLVDNVTGCWIWQHGTARGRGRLIVDGKGLEAHRWVYEQQRGPIPSGLQLDHLCCNPICVNPDHMEPVTHAENFRRDRLRRQVVSQLWLAMREGGHDGVLRLDERVMGRIVDDRGAWTLEPVT